MTLPPLVLILFLFWFWFLILLLHADGVVVSHLFLAVDIGITALSITAAIVLGAIVPREETNMAPTTTTMVMMNKMHYGHGIMAGNIAC